MLVLLLQPIDKFPHAGQNPVAMIDDTVHITDKSILLSQTIHMFVLSFRRKRGIAPHVQYPSVSSNSICCRNGMLGNDKISILYSVYHIFYVMQRNLCFIAVYLLSPYFACALPCPSFTIISPDVILDYGIKTGILLFDTKQLFYYKTAWMGFFNHTHTV